MAEAFNVLISSAGRRVSLLRCFRSALEALGLEGRILASDASRYAAAFEVADQSFLVPPISDEGFAEGMLRLCEEQGVRLLVPTLDPELEVYAEHRERFTERGTTIAVSSPEVTRIGADKIETHSWLQAAGFATVDQCAATDLEAHAHEFPYPLIVKPRRGSASKGVSVVNDQTQLRAATSGADFIVQAIAPGDEYTIDLLADRQGRCVACVPRRRIEVRAGEVSKAVTERKPELIALGRDLVEALPGAFGALSAQVFAGEADPGRVIEMNARFGGGFPLTWQAGGLFPKWLIQETLNQTIEDDVDAWQDGLVMLRFDEAVFVAQGAGP